MTFYHEFTRADGSTVTVEFEFEEGSGDYFAGGCWMPGDPPEVTIVKVFDDNGDVELTTDEDERATEEICVNPPEPPDLWDDFY